MMRLGVRAVFRRLRLHDGGVESPGIRSGRPRSLRLVPARDRVHRRARLRARAAMVWAALQTGAGVRDKCWLGAVTRE